ncbi:MAG: hypothetical protein KC462_06900, partial [Cyanobacteria bacterium HKST-UBA05]|nr:hypothetical protein [Cyanobacteria bacterium HKST-UBA05]
IIVTNDTNADGSPKLFYVPPSPGELNIIRTGAGRDIVRGADGADVRREYWNVDNQLMEVAVLYNAAGQPTAVVIFDDEDVVDGRPVVTPAAQQPVTTPLPVSGTGNGSNTTEADDLAALVEQIMQILAQLEGVLG